MQCHKYCVGLRVQLWDLDQWISATTSLIGYKTVYRTLYEFTTSITHGRLSCNLLILGPMYYVLGLELQGQRL